MEHIGGAIRLLLVVIALGGAILGVLGASLVWWFL